MNSRNPRQLVEQLALLDEQPSETQMQEMRGRIGKKVNRMKRFGRWALYVSLTGGVLMLAGFLSIVLTADRQQDNPWIATLSMSLFILGGIVVVAGCIGLVINRGFGYAFARHDYSEACLIELTLKVDRISQQLDELLKEKRGSSTSS